jgi:hypothetical protein
MRRLESLWYETSPYLYLVVGLVSALISDTATGLVFSALLVGASVTIFRLRRNYRSPESWAYRKYSRGR